MSASGPSDPLVVESSSCLIPHFLLDISSSTCTYAYVHSNQDLRFYPILAHVFFLTNNKGVAC